MIFKAYNLAGAFIIELETKEDERGFFARTYCKREFEKVGLDFEVVQANLSWNNSKGTLRGMHYQAAPHAEAKLVQCVKGKLYDVIVDLRKGSETYCCWQGVELSEENGRLIYVPEGFAHGFQTLEDETAVYYMMSAFFNSESARGVRWNDPAFGIKWPLEEKIISSKDRSWPDYQA